MKNKLLPNLFRIGFILSFIPALMISVTWLWEENSLAKGITLINLAFIPALLRLAIELLEFAYSNSFQPFESYITKVEWTLTTDQRLVGLSLNFAVLLGCLLPVMDELNPAHTLISYRTGIIFTIIVICFYAVSLIVRTWDVLKGRRNKDMFKFDGNFSKTLTYLLNTTIFMEICFYFFRTWATLFAIIPTILLLIFLKFMDAYYMDGLFFESKKDNPDSSFGRFLQGMCLMVLLVSLVSQFWHYEILRNTPLWKFLLYALYAGLVIIVSSVVLSKTAPKESKSHSAT